MNTQVCSLNTKVLSTVVLTKIICLMKTIEFAGTLTITREVYIDAPLKDVAVALNKKPEEVENMSQEDLEELLMDNIYTIDAIAFNGRIRGFDYHDDVMGEELNDLIINDTDEVVE